MFTTTSRYYPLPVLAYVNADGSELRYVSRRFLPPGNQFALLSEHRVVERERLDNITAQYLDDAEQFWRICDANEAMSPFHLATPGSIVLITLPQGIPGPRSA
jgi:hypothetical protein